jgi:hypothetical protein
MRRLGTTLLLAVLLVMAIVSPAKAATTGSKSVSSKGITISPAIINVSLDQNLHSTSFKINVENKNSSPVNLKLFSLDFKSLNETGGVAFIGTGGNYGLANWLVLPSEPIKLAAKSSQLITISVDNRTDLAPGGHYAAILFDNAGQSGSGSNKVTINQVASTLVFLKKSGGEIYKLSLQNPDFGSTWLRLPHNVNLLISNTGNTQTVPRGILVITDPLGHEVRRGVLNGSSAMVLPGSDRLIRVDLFREAKAWLPGRYKATISYRPADSDTAQTTTYSFVYLNPILLILIIVLLIFGMLYLRNYRSWQEPKPPSKNKHKGYPQKPKQL